jgi:hypothetical protein
MILPLLVFLAGPPVPGSGHLIDAAGLFSRDAVARAEKRIVYLRRAHDTGMALEAVAQQPDLRHLAGAENAAERERALDRWARGKGLAAGARRGVFVLISKSPRDARVVALPDEKAAPADMLARIRDAFLERLGKAPDEALSRGLDRWGEELGPVLDPFNLFSRAGKAEAAARIARLAAEYQGYELIVETALEPEEIERLRGFLNTVERNKAIDRWARERAVAVSILRGRFKGLFMVIGVRRGEKRPRDVRVVGWPDEVEDRVPPSKRWLVQREMEGSLQSNPDRGLDRSIVKFQQVLEQVKEHYNPLPAIPMLVLLGGLTAGWVVLTVARRQLYRGGAVVPPLYPPAVQGSIFGSPAGLWINDQLFAAEAALNPAPVPGSETSPRPSGSLGGETSPRPASKLGGETSPRPPGEAPPQ